MMKTSIDQADLRSDSESICHGHFVSVGGLNLHYVSAGSGRPVVLIHGNPGSHQDYTMALLDKLSRSFRVIVFDRPGHGSSERYDSVATTVEMQAAMVREALTRLSIRKPILVGHSWGGALALAAAVAFEDELAGIVLLAPAAYPNFSREWWSLVPGIPVLGKFLVHTGAFPWTSSRESKLERGLPSSSRAGELCSAVCRDVDQAETDQSLCG
jgi:pimeloyl-ACP methyl ester carboxylesterase